MVRVKAAHGAPDGRSRLADAIFITTIVRGGRGDGGEFDSHLSADCPLAKKWRFCTRAFFPNCLFLFLCHFLLLHIKAATDCLCWITNCSVLTTYLFVQSITNAAGGKCQRAHHIISARRRRPAERETCQLRATGRTWMVKEKFL